MIKNIFIKKVIILLVIILVIVLISFFVLWFGIGINDAKENRERTELSYNELSKKYQMSDGYSFKMDYAYSIKRNIGFFSGGGYVGTDCWERYIRDAWTNEEIMSISLCKDEKITKEKLDTLNEFWEKYIEIFKQ